MLNYFLSQETRKRGNKVHGPYLYLRESRTNKAVYLGKVEVPDGLVDEVTRRFPNRVPTKEEVLDLL